MAQDGAHSFDYRYEGRPDSHVRGLITDILVTKECKASAREGYFQTSVFITAVEILFHCLFYFLNKPSEEAAQGLRHLLPIFALHARAYPR